MCKKIKAFTKTVPNSCLGSAEWILLPPNGHEMNNQHLICWKSEFYWYEKQVVSLIIKKAMHL